MFHACMREFEGSFPHKVLNTFAFTLRPLRIHQIFRGVQWLRHECSTCAAAVFSLGRCTNEKRGKKRKTPEISRFRELILAEKECRPSSTQHYRLHIVDNIMCNRNILWLHILNFKPMIALELFLVFSVYRNKVFIHFSLDIFIFIQSSRHFTVNFTVTKRQTVGHRKPAESVK